MRSQICLFAFVLLLSCAVSSTSAQNCLTNNDTSHTLLPINVTDVNGIALEFQYPAGRYNGTSAAVSYWEKWMWNTMTVCLFSLEESSISVPFFDIGAAMLSITKECSSNTTFFLGGFYPLTKQDQYGGLVYVMSSNITNCLPPYY